MKSRTKHIETVENIYVTERHNKSLHWIKTSEFSRYVSCRGIDTRATIDS